MSSEAAGALAHDFADQRVLGVVGVLVFVHQDVPEAPAVRFGERREGAEHVDGFGDEVVKVHGVGLAQPLGVALEDVGHGLFEGIVVVGGGGVGIGVDQLVLQRRDLVLDGLGRELLGVQVQGLGHLGDKPQGVRGVIDGEIGLESDVGGFLPEDAHAGRVEGGNPHDLGAAAHQRLDALPHFRGGLVGEGDGQDLAVMRPPGGDEVGDPVTEYAGLAGSGSGHDQQRAAGVLDRFFLLGVEALQEFVHAGQLGTCPFPLGFRPAVPVAGRIFPCPGARLGERCRFRGSLERSVSIRVKQHIHGDYKSRRWGRHSFRPACVRLRA